MSFEFKPEYYQAKVSKEEAIQSELFKGGVELPALFALEMRVKWERLCLEQQPVLPEVKKTIPNAWKRRVKESDSKVLNFVDCSREMIKEAV